MINVSIKKKIQKSNRFNCKKQQQQNHGRTEFETQLTHGSRTHNKSFFKSIRRRKPARDYVGPTDK